MMMLKKMKKVMRRRKKKRAAFPGNSTQARSFCGRMHGGSGPLSCLLLVVNGIEGGVPKARVFF